MSTQTKTGTTQATQTPKPTIEFNTPEANELNKIVDEWYTKHQTSPFNDIQMVEDSEGEISVDMEPEFGDILEKVFGDKQSDVLGDYIGALLKTFIDDVSSQPTDGPLEDGPVNIEQ